MHESAPPSDSAAPTRWLWAWALIVGVFVVAFATTSLQLGLPNQDQDDSRLGLFRAAIVQPLGLARLWVTVGDQVGPATISDRGPILVYASLILLVAWAAGSLTLRFLNPQPLGLLLRFVVAMALGVHFVSLATLALGLAGWLDAWVLFWPALGIVVAAGLAEVSALRTPPPPAPPKPLDEPPQRWPLAILGILSLGIIVQMFLGAMLPPSDFDVRAYHLQVPKEWFQAGLVTFLDHNAYAQMPLGAEMPALAAMTFTGDWQLGGLVGKTIIGFSSLLAVLAVFGIGQRLGNSTAGAIAALVLLGTPWLGYMAKLGLVDMASGLLVLLSFWTAYESRHTPTNSGRWTVLAGLLTGAACSVKYPNVVLVALPLAIWIAWPKPTGEPHRWRSALTTLLLFVLVAAASGGLWYAKNAAFTGNPVYPLLTDWLGPETRDPAAAQRWQAAHDAGPYTLEALRESLSTFALKSRYQGFALVPILLGLLFVRRWPKALASILVALAIYLVGWWLLTHRIERFWVPILPLASVAAGLAGVLLWQAARWSRWLVVTLLTLGIVWHTVFLTIFDSKSNGFLAPIAELTRENTRPELLWLNEHAPPESRVMIVGNGEVYDLTMPLDYATVFDRSNLEQLAQGRTSDEVHRRLVERGISMLLVDWEWIARYREPDNYGYSDFVEPRVFERLMRDGVLEPTELGPPGRPGEWPIQMEIYRVLPLEESAASRT
jgi:hypothetical protein